MDVDMPKISDAVCNQKDAKNSNTSMEQEKQRSHDGYTRSVDGATDTDILKMLGMIPENESEDAQSAKNSAESLSDNDTEDEDSDAED
eukprot:8202163-Karenia_brevis.AAC.1